MIPFLQGIPPAVSYTDESVSGEAKPSEHLLQTGDSRCILTPNSSSGLLWRWRRRSELYGLRKEERNVEISLWKHRRSWDTFHHARKTGDKDYN